MDFTPLKTQLAKSFLCVTVSPPAVPPRRTVRRRLLRSSPRRRADPEPSAPSEPPLPNLDAVFLFPIVCVFFFVFFFLFFLFCVFRHTQDGTRNSKHPPPPHGFLLQLLRAEIRDRWKTESWKSRCSQVHESRGRWPRSAASAPRKGCPWPPPSAPPPVSPAGRSLPRRPAASLRREMRPGPLPGGAAVSPEARDAL